MRAVLYLGKLQPGVRQPWEVRPGSCDPGVPWVRRGLSLGSGRPGSRRAGAAGCSARRSVRLQRLLNLSTTRQRGASVLFLSASGLIHTGRGMRCARKLERKYFDVACVQ